jgi:hypothetical protein
MADWDLQQFVSLKWIKRLPALVVLILVGVVSCLTFVVCGTLVTGLWFGLSRASGAMTLNWELPGLMEGIFALAAFALGVGAGLLALVELIEISESRNLEVYKDIFDKMMAPEEVNRRRRIYQLPEDMKERVDKAVNDPATNEDIKRVLNVLDYLGFLIMQDGVARNEVLRWVSPMVVKLWEKLGPLVERERGRRPKEPDYYEAAMFLAEKCQKWRERKYGTDETDYLEEPL